MRALIIGGTGLISTGIVKHLRDRGVKITMFNRGLRENTVGENNAGADIKTLHGDRNDFKDFEGSMEDERFDAVIDMICFTPDQANSAVRAFKGKCDHFIFCSTVCTYGPKIDPAHVVVNETFPQEPISGYGKNKLLCEQIFYKAHAEKAFNMTIVRPSNTYGPGNPLIDQLEGNSVAWDRLLKGKPILCGGDGRGLWVSTHRDDCGKLFAYGACNPKTYGQSYNATRELNFTWRDYLREAAGALNTTAKVLFMPPEWIVAHDPKRFGLLHDITQFHGAYDSSKGRRDIPEFKCEIDFRQGAAETLADVRRREAWRTSDGDEVYDEMVKKALAAGVTPVELQ